MCWGGAAAKCLARLPFALVAMGSNRTKKRWVWVCGAHIAPMDHAPLLVTHLDTITLITNVLHNPWKRRAYIFNESSSTLLRNVKPVSVVTNLMNEVPCEKIGIGQNRSVTDDSHSDLVGVRDEGHSQGDLLHGRRPVHHALDFAGIDLQRRGGARQVGH